MNLYEKNKFSMFLGTHAVLTQHREIVDTVAPLAESTETFRLSIGEIQERDKTYMTVTAGSTAAKNNALERIATEALRVANALYASGRRTDNEQLKAECRISMSELMHRRDGEIELYCGRIAELAQSFAADLAPYGITAEEIAEYGRGVTTYRQLADSMQQKFAESKATREALHDSFKTADDILKEDLDTLMEMLRDRHPDFYRQYWAARTIRDIGGSHASKNGANGNGGTREETPVDEPVAAVSTE